VRECSDLLSNIVLQDDINDKWKWLLDPIHGYYVHGAYKYLTSTDDSTDRHHLSNIWQHQVPLKVSLFGWRLLRNRLPTKDNLFRRHVITSYRTICSSGCGLHGTVEHLFISCSTFERV